MILGYSGNDEADMNDMITSKCYFDYTLTKPTKKELFRSKITEILDRVFEVPVLKIDWFDVKHLLISNFKIKIDWIQFILILYIIKYL